jgi:putative transcriptional regulator
MGERKLKVIDVARDTGLHRNTITLLYQESAVRIDLDALEILCRYFNVKVGEFLALTDGSAGTAGEKAGSQGQ